jgi:hypothetical protein
VRINCRREIAADGRIAADDHSDEMSGR